MKIKRLFSAMLAVVILSGALVFSADAAGTPTGDEWMDVTINSSVSEAGDGDVITFYVNVKNNFHATNMRWPVLFDSAAFELVGENGNATAYGALAANESIFQATDKTGDARLYPSGYRVNRYGVLLLHWIGGALSGTTATYRQPTGMNCVSFQLRVKAGSSGTGNVLIPPNSNLFYNQAMNDPTNPDSIYRWNLVAGSTLTLTPAQVSLGALDPGLAIVEDAPTNVIIEEFDDEIAEGLGFNGYIYGFDESIIYEPLLGDDDFKVYFDAVGGAEMVVTPSPGGYGTGTLIEVYYSGVLLKSYYIVILGDATGDCFVDDNDLAVINDAANYLPDWMNIEIDMIYGTVGSPYKKACDIDCDTAVDTIDVTNEELFYFGYISVPQTCSGVIDYL